MGRQINFDFDEADEQMLIERLEQAESWAGMSTTGAKWQSLKRLSKARSVLLAPARLVPKLKEPKDPRRHRGQMLVWTRTDSPTIGEVTLGRARIWFDTRRTPDHAVKRAFDALARLIASNSPCFADDGGSPIFVGPHLASQFESGAHSAG